MARGPVMFYARMMMFKLSLEFTNKFPIQTILFLPGQLVIIYKCTSLLCLIIGQLFKCIFFVLVLESRH